LIITLNFIYKQKLIDKFNNIKRLHWIKKTGELKDFVNAIADGEDFVAKEDQAEEMVISLDDQKEIEETLEKDQDN